MVGARRNRGVARADLLGHEAIGDGTVAKLTFTVPTPRPQAAVGLGAMVKSCVCVIDQAAIF